MAQVQKVEVELSFQDRRILKRIAEAQEELVRLLRKPSPVPIPATLLKEAGLSENNGDVREEVDGGPGRSDPPD